jgi:hypothetical protein
MTRDQIKEVIDRVLRWPSEDQEKLVDFVAELERWRNSDHLDDFVGPRRV